MHLDDYHRRNGGGLAERAQQIEYAQQWSEAFAAAFEPKRLVAGMTRDNREGNFWNMLTASPEYAELRKLTALRPGVARTACHSLAESYLQWLQTRQEGPGGDGDEDSSGDAGDEGADGGEPQPGDDKAAQEAARKALENAEAADGLDMLPGGLGQSFELSQDGPERDAALCKINGTRLHELARIAGRLRIVADGVITTDRDEDEHEELSGIGPGRRVADLLPGELDALDDPDRWAQVAYRLAEGIADCRTYDAPAREGMGPLVILTDNSGSMDGDRIIAANAVVLALAHLAKIQHRKIAAAWWNSSPDSFRKSWKIGGEKVAERAVKLHASGGTQPELPLVMFPRTLWPTLDEQFRRRADVVLITDASFGLWSDLIQQWREFAQANRVKLLTIVIGANCSDDLRELSDKVWEVEQASDVGRELMLQLVK